MIELISVILVMPIYVLGLLFIFIYNVLSSFLGLNDNRLSYDNFGNFIDYHKYSLSVITIVVLFLFFS